MNFLAHCALANDASQCWPDGEPWLEGLLAGAVLADFSKGHIPQALPAELQAGIRLHRRIDAYSNQHPAIRDACANFPKELRRLAPIFIDILTDHYLSLAWHDYYPAPRTAFTTRCYEACEHYSSRSEYADLEPLRRFINYMRDSDLLASYHQWTHVERGLHSVLRRLGKEALLPEVVAACRAQHDSGQSAFRIYFPDLRQQLASWSQLMNPKRG
jgi:acyl carrier protein phosphodiesterase